MKKILLSVFALATLFTAFPELAHAEGSADWIKPASTIIDTLQSGFVKLGAGVIGVGIIIFGLVTTLTGEGNWKKLGVMIIGGVLIFFGPEIAVSLLEVAGN